MAGARHPALRVIGRDEGLRLLGGDEIGRLGFATTRPPSTGCDGSRSIPGRGRQGALDALGARPGDRPAGGPEDGPLTSVVSAAARNGWSADSCSWETGPHARGRVSRPLTTGGQPRDHRPWQRAGHVARDATMTKLPSIPVAPRVDDRGLRPAVTIAPSSPLHQAARIMRAHDVSALVVGRPGELVSIVTERDLTQAQADGLAPGTAVSAVASSDPLTVLPDATVLDAAMLMLRHGVRHLIVAHGRRAIGVLSMRDVLEALVAAVTPDTILVMLEQVRIDPPELWLG